MNSVNVKESLLQEPSIERGDLFKDPDDGEVFILASTGVKGYTLISLKNGNRYRAEENTPEAAAKDLVRIGRNFLITIEQQ